MWTGEDKCSSFCNSPIYFASLLSVPPVSSGMWYSSLFVLHKELRLPIYQTQSLVVTPLCEPMRAGRRNNHKTTDERQRTSFFSIPHRPGNLRSNTRAEARKQGLRAPWSERESLLARALGSERVLVSKSTHGLPVLPGI